jgi:hypothetical protein
VQGLLFALFTNCSLLCRGCCLLYLQTVPCCAGAAVRFIYKLFLSVQGLLFALFTSIMFGTQVSAIWYDETGIEALKKEEARYSFHPPQQ